MANPTGTRGRPRKYKPMPCANCGKTFQPKSKAKGRPPQRYCSLSCAAGANSRARWASRPRTNGAGRVAARRRRRMRHQGTWDGITDQQILERDRWMCWLCKRRIGKTFKYPHPRSASIDHLLPLSLGGDDTEYNKKAAHLGCNVTRGNGRPGEQMPLAFGLDAYAEIARPKRSKPCVTCGATPGSNCRLHMPVYYFTCPVCQCLFVHKRQSRIYCSAKCSASAHHDRMIQAKPAHLRGLQAKTMRESGMGLDEIADRLGYSGASYAAAAIARATGQRSGRRTQPYVRQPRVSV